MKRKKIEPEPEEWDELDEPYVPDDCGLTYKMRYTVGMLKPERSDKGTKCFGLFFETEKLVKAKKEAEKAFKEDNLEVVIWDRDKWSSDTGCEVARYVPETEVKDDDERGTRRDNKTGTGTGTVKDDEDAVELRNSGRPKRREPKKRVSKPRPDNGIIRGPRKKIPPSKRKKRKR